MQKYGGQWQFNFSFCMGLEQKEMPVKSSNYKQYIDKADKHWNWILDLGLEFG